jgi:hypothetical protein
MSRSAVCDVIRIRGQFKQASPEDREVELSERSRLMRAIHARQGAKCLAGRSQLSLRVSQ